MKSILSAAALLAVMASPVLAEEAVAPQPKVEAGVVQEIVLPAATGTPVGEAQAATEAEAQTKAAAAKDHGCASRQTVYLTN